MKRFALLWLAAASFAFAETPPAEELFARSLQRFAALLSPEAKERVELRATLAFTRSEGLPKALRDATLDFAIAAPDRLRLGTLVEKQRIEFGRIGQELWIAQPGKNFAVRGLPGVPRFAMDAASVDGTGLAPLGLRLDPDLLRRLPKLFRVTSSGTVEIEGVVCTQLTAVPLPEALEALEALGLAAFTLELAIRPDLLPARLGWRSGKTDALVELKNLRLGPPAPDAEWQLPATAEMKVERVALSHLSTFFSAAFASLDSRTEKLGPARGARQLAATHGAGRLEIHDDTKVLWVRGTPEEMGAQHGALLRDEVRDLVKRVLYGVGVGSSFDQGRWFFGEIEGCVARLAPFLDARTLREMDALATAASLHPAEVRLANFFPEMFHCSGFALLGDATVGRRLYHGRILDYMKGIGLERNAVVTVVQPDEGHAWVNIGYAGFTGSVTAMNAQHISIGEMGGRGEGHWDGKPMAQLVREVMEKASTLDEAIAIMRRGPRTCEYYYVIADGRAGRAVGIKGTPEIFEVVETGAAHPQLDTPVKDTVLLSAGDRYKELVRRVQAGFGAFDADKARDLMTRPVAMSSCIHSVLFAPDTLDFWVANSDGDAPASHLRYTKYNLRDLLTAPPAPAAAE